jgi:hypothetical protein
VCGYTKISNTYKIETYEYLHYTSSLLGNVKHYYNKIIFVEVIASIIRENMKEKTLIFCRVEPTQLADRQLRNTAIWYYITRT